MEPDRQFPSIRNSEVRAVLFDCDGVLCPPMRFAEVLNTQFGITREMTAQFFLEAFNPALIGEADLLEILPPFLEKWGWRSSAQEFLSLWLSSERETDPEVVELINAVRAAGYFCGLATNQELNRAQYFRAEMNLDESFDRLFISCELGAMKPQARFFELVTEALGLNPESIVFLDDQEKYVAAARKHGWHAIQFDSARGARARLVELLESQQR